MGETTFLRLRWLAPLDGGAPIRDAEILRQSLREIRQYRYGGMAGLPAPPGGRAKPISPRKSCR